MRPDRLPAPAAALLAAFLLLPTGPARAQQAGALDAPIVLEERSGADQPALPVVFGLPLPAGTLKDVPPLEVRSEGRVLPAAGEALSRWEDGSIRWLRVEFVAPPLAAGGVFRASLRPRSAAEPPDGTLELQRGESGVLRVDTGAVRFRTAAGAGELFRLDGPNGPVLAGPAVSRVTTAAGELRPVAAAAWEVERSGELSLDLKRIDELGDDQGRIVALLTTRVRLFRGSDLIRLQQSLDLLAGVHRLRSWRLELPAAGPGRRTWAPLPDGRLSVRRGDAEVIQAEADAFRFQGREIAGAFPGVVAVAPLTVGVVGFRDLLPTSAARRGDLLTIDFAPGRPGAELVLEEGFGRTVEVWLRAAPPRATDLQALAARLAAPPRPHATAEWYLASGAVGALAAARAGEDAAFEERLAQSADRVLAARERDPAHHFGLLHFGDFQDGEHSLAYAGPLQQEYDPGVVLIRQFLRTGDPDWLDPALELAWHYADVDLTPQGGAFQHRATQHHVDAWIAGILARSLADEYRASPQADGTLAGELAWAEANWGAEAAATLADWLDEERARGLAEAELQERLFEMVGFHMVRKMAERLEPPARSLREYAERLSSFPEARRRGYTDAQAAFQDFFALYGGSWDEFPAFHTDPGAVPDERHQSGHAVVEGLALAHLLTGEARLRERALAFGAHHVRREVPRAIAALVERRDENAELLHTRTAAWPLVNLDVLADLSCGMPGEESLHADLLAAMRDCVAVLASVPADRVRSSIHAGITLEGLARWHRRTGDPVAAACLTDLARYWAKTQYDWQEHAFRYRAEGPTEAYPGMSGLVLYGLAYAESLEHDEDLWAVIEDAWQHLPQRTGYAKAFAMLYRTAPLALERLRNLRSIRP
ncbi:MAG: hypothetical protein D6702_07060 [Planctomycetota bacterium]|nr:MAG: hypothetical protein D6702_07060 [Planctomycetota bacterium]